MPTVEQRLQRFDKAKERRINWEETYKDALRYTAQRRETFDFHERGEKKNTEIFDSTAISAVQKFASNIQSGMVPPFKKWTKLVPGTEIAPENQAQAAEQLEAVNDTMFKFLHASNFDTQVSESFVDLGMGTGALLVLEGDDANPLNFVAVPLSELYLEEGPYGRIQTVFRQFRMNSRNIKAQWPKGTLPEDTPEDKDIDVIESTIFDEVTKNYEYSVMLKDSKHEVFKEDQKTSPWVVFRWSKMPTEVFGRGPVLDALADIKTLNKTVELLLKSAALKMIPTFVAADDGVINPFNIKIEPGGIIPVAPFGPGGSPLQPLQVGGDINLGQFVIDRMQSRIDDMMFTNPLGDVNLPVKTATEISLRQQDLANRIGSSFGRLQFEFIGPLVNRVLDILDRRGLLPVSLGDIKVDGKAISIDYQSPLAQAQDEEELVNTLRYVETIVGTVGPQMLPMFVNIQEFAKIVSKNLGVSEKLQTSDEQRAQAMQLIAQITQGQQQGGAPVEQ